MKLPYEFPTCAALVVLGSTANVFCGAITAFIGAMAMRYSWIDVASLTFMGGTAAIITGLLHGLANVCRPDSDKIPFIPRQQGWWRLFVISLFTIPLTGLVAATVGYGVFWITSVPFVQEGFVGIKDVTLDQVFKTAVVGTLSLQAYVLLGLHAPSDAMFVKRCIGMLLQNHVILMFQWASHEHLDEEEKPTAQIEEKQSLMVH